MAFETDALYSDMFQDMMDTKEKVIRLEFDIKLKDKMLAQMRYEAKRNHFLVLRKENDNRRDYFNSISATLEDKYKLFKEEHMTTKEIVNELEKIVSKFRNENQTHYDNNEKNINKKLEEIDIQIAQNFEVDLELGENFSDVDLTQLDQPMQDKIKKEIERIRNHVESLAT